MCFIPNKSRAFHSLIVLMLSLSVTISMTGCLKGGGSSSSSVGDSASDENTSSEENTTSERIVLPVDPRTVATPTNPTMATDIFGSTAFLYSGNAPIQRNVTQGTIDADRAAVVRGKVLDKGNRVLPGVKITILDHPEYGHTYSRTDGMFDMAVNGGETLTVRYEKDGYMTLQRSSRIPKKDFFVFDDVVLTAISAKVTEIDLQNQTEPFSLLEGETTIDSRGERKAVVLFPKTTSAQMVMPDGSLKTLTGPMHIRATEYTAGDNGPNAMPADLPKGVAYTYCVEMRVDEAEAAGATGVVFSEPVINYVENFIGFPVGDAVPSYYYDKESANWVRVADGKVIAVVGVTNELADIDIDGDNMADDVGDLNITDEERKRIATLYQPGTELWRVPLSHFTPIDHNWPDPPVPDNAEENEPDDDSLNQEDSEVECEAHGSIIECQKQTLGERVPVVGTPLTLNYRSERTSGDLRKQTLYVQLTKEAWLYTLEEIQLELLIAGRKIKTSFEDFTPNMKFKYVWDGKDVYGRELYGPQTITVKLSYIYLFDPESSPGLTTGEASSSASQNVNAEPYQVRVGTQYDSGIRALATGEETTAGNLVSGGEPSQVRMGPDYARSIHVWNSTVVKQNVMALGIEGWSLGSHHQLDLSSQEILLGNGRVQKNVVPINNPTKGTITTIAGTGQYGYTGDGGSALNATFGANDVAIGPDGSIFISDPYHHVVRKIDTNGIVHTIAGTGDDDWHYAYVPEQPALNAKLGGIHGIETDAFGSVYLINTINDSSFGGYGGTIYSSVLKITPDGTISTVAGNNVNYLYNNQNTCDDYPVRDNEQATAGCLGRVTGLAVKENGEFYISVGNHHQIRKIGLDGIITTVAGTGETGYSGDGGDAKNAQLRYPEGLDVGSDGSIYFSSNNLVIRKISPDGTITTIGGSGTYGYSGDGGGALLADIGTYSTLSVDLTGNIYLPDSNSVIRKIDTRGVIDTIAGASGVYSYAGDYGDMADATFQYLRTVKVDDNYDLYIVDGSRIRKVRMENLSGNSGFEIPSKNVKEIYRFDRNQKHIHTLNAFNGRIEKSFVYNEEGYLTQVKDSYGRITTLEYGEGERVSAIVSPYGQRTTLNYDAKGHLVSITNPANESWRFDYTDDGLVTAITKPDGHRSSYDYDQEGALTKATDAAGGTQTIERSYIINGYETSKTTKLGRVTKYRVENLDNGLQRLLNTMPSGLQYESNITRSGSSSIVTTYPDGTVVTTAGATDPRFGASVNSFIRVRRIKMPSGLTATLMMDKEANLGNSSDPLSLVSQTDTVVMNGDTYTRRYDNTTNTVTMATPEGRTLVTAMNPHGSVIKRVSGNLRAVEYKYNEQGQLTEIRQGSRTVTLIYNSDGYLSSITNPLNQTTNFTYDAAGRVVKQSFSNQREINFSYDAMGNLLSLTPPQKPTHNFIYTLIGNIKKYNPPTVTGTGATTYSYNDDRQLTTVHRPDGQNINYSYDTAGRLIGIGNNSYTYDVVTGKMSTVNSGNGETLEYTYDGSLLTKTIYSGPVAGTVSRSYDNNFRITALTVNGNTIDYGYDHDGLIVRAGDLTMTRDGDNGYVTATTLNTISDTRSFNSFGELESYDVSSLLSWSYTRDGLGRITKIVENVESGTSHTFTYSYDTEGRIGSVSKDEIVIETYTYDANGNRIGSNGIDASYDDQDRLLTFGTKRYAFNANGELIRKTEDNETTNYSYDILGNLKSVALPDGTVVSYIVDGLDRRVGKKVNGTLVQGFLYMDALNPIAELDGSNNIVSRFVYGSKSNVPDYMIKNGVTYRIVSDHLGSPRLVVNTANSEVVQRIDYDVWGNVVNDTNPGFQPFGFAGGIYDNHTRLTHFGAREYDAATGRWMTKDPISFAGGDSNLYAYASDNPLNIIDPNGKFGVIAGAVAVAAGIAIIASNIDSLQDFIDSLNNLRHSSDALGGIADQDEITQADLDQYNNWRSDTADAAVCGGRVGANAPGVAGTGGFPTSTNDLIAGEILNRLINMLRGYGH